jgi:predicted phage-related endonuclease
MPNSSPLRDAFLAERKKGIGGSDAASLFNAGYGCRLRLWRDKRNEKPDYPREENDAMELGNVLEPFFARKYERATGHHVIEREEPTVHPEHPELRVNVDYMIDDPTDDNREVGVLEIKSVGRAMFQKIKREGLPEDYILQLQHGILVTESDWGAFAIGSRDSGELASWEVEKDRVLCDLIVAEGVAFWAEVQSGQMPDRLDPDDHRCQKCEYRKSCQGAALIQLEPTRDIERDETLRPLVTEYLERKALLDEANDLAEETKEELKTKLGTRQAVEVAGHKIYFRPQTAMRGDFGALAVAYDELRRLVMSVLDRYPELGSPDHPFGDDYQPAETFKKISHSRPLRFF